VAGVVYSPEFVIVPQLEFPCEGHVIDQLTAVSELPVTEPMNCSDPPIGKDMLAGLIVMIVGGGGCTEEETDPPVQPHVKRTKITSA
jgi:hypothetical protein